MTAHTARQATGAKRPVFSTADPILTSKITAPGVPGWVVRRRRLDALLAESIRWRPLTVVTGPPGAGKTMALAAWAAAAPGPVAWVSLEEHDNRPVAFWSYVVAALRRSGIHMPRTALAATRARADHSVFLQLASALADQNPPAVLVLDDFHLVTEPKVLAGLDFLLRNTGAGLRLVVSSRIDPPLRLHRYRLAGELGEIRARDLAFSTTEAQQLMAQHGAALLPDSLELLTRRTEGWAAGLRLAALSMDTHADPDQFVRELIAEDSALTGYLVEEVLSTQPPQVQDVLLSTSILEHVHPEAASELVGDEKAARVLLDAASSNAFIQPLESGWYRYHQVFADVLRLKLRRSQPDRVPELHRRAARWFAENGRLTEAVRHASQSGDWELAASLVIEPLAIGEIIAPRGDSSLGSEFAGLPAGRMWATAPPYLITAAEALSADQLDHATAALDAADDLLDQVPAGQAAAGQAAAARLTSAILRITACRRAGDGAGLAMAVPAAETLLAEIPDEQLSRHADVGLLVRCGRGVAELWSGHLDEAASTLDSAVLAAVAQGAEGERAGCLGLLALAEAARGQLDRAAELAGQATAVSAGELPAPASQLNPAALVAAAWVRLERGELREAHDWLKQADAALAADPDRLTDAAACLLVAWCALAEGRAGAARQFVTRARDGWSAPAWLDHMLTAAQARAWVAAGDIPAALEVADGDGSLEAMVARAHAWAAAGNDEKAGQLLAPALAVGDEAPERVRVQARLLEARLGYRGGDPARGRRAFAAALRLAEHEQLRLPFVLEHSWAGQAVDGNPGLATRYHRLLGLAPPPGQPPAPGQPSAGPSAGGPAEGRILVVEPLTEREREVLRHASAMLNTAEIASEMYISTNTVKTHLKSAYRKLAAGHRGEAVRRARQLQLL
jgi:LuxR family maltose regulon positive regulatory protein